MRLEKCRLSKNIYEKNLKELRDFAAQRVQHIPRGKESESKGVKSEESAGKVSIMETGEKNEKIIESKATDKDCHLILRDDD